MQSVSTCSSMEDNDGASSCDGREYVHSNSEEGKDDYLNKDKHILT